MGPPGGACRQIDARVCQQSPPL